VEIAIYVLAILIRGIMAACLFVFFTYKIFRYFRSKKESRKFCKEKNGDTDDLFLQILLIGTIFAEVVDTITLICH